MNGVDLLILVLRLALVALLYLFLVAVLRQAVAGTRRSVAVSGRSGSRVVAQLRLLVLEAGESNLSAGEVLELGDGTTLGRSERADVMVGDTAISSEHARIDRAGRRWVVADLGSTNGTRVNDALIRERTALREGDVLGLGTVRLQVLAR